MTRHPAPHEIAARRHPRRRLVAIVGGACVVLATVAPAALAAPTWLSPVNVSAAGQPAADPQVVMDQNADSMAVWVGSGGVVRLARRHSGAAFGAPIDLSAAGGAVAAPQVVDSANDVFAIWERGDGSNSRVQTSTAGYDGVATAPVDVSAAGEDAHNPQIVDAYGGAVAVWERSDGTNSIVQESERPSAGSFSTPVDVSVAGQDALDPAVGDIFGDVLVAWRRFDGTNWRMQVATKPRDGAFAAPVDLSAAGGDALSPQLAVDDYNHVAVVVWRRFDGAHWIVQAAVRSAAGTFSAPVDLSAPGEDALDPDLAMNGSGDATIVWRAVTGAGNVVKAVTRPQGGTFSAPATLSVAAPNAMRPQVAGSGGGGFAVVWRRLDGTNDVVQGVRRAYAATGFSAPVDVSAPGEEAGEPQVSNWILDDATAVWRNSDGTIRAAGLDASGPSLLYDIFLSLGPETAVAGRPVAFGRPIATDVWSAVGATTWSFGDGTSTAAPGATVTHTYASPGTYTVSPTVVDAVGNATTVSDQIRITTAPAPPPPPPPPGAVAPRLTNLRLSRAAFRAAAKGPSTTSAAPRRTGTRVSYDLGGAGIVQFRVERAVLGRLVGGACVHTSKANRARRHCPRYASVPGGFVGSHPAGANHVTFTGRLQGRSLRPGRYRLVAMATRGHLSAAGVRRGFRIVR